MKLLAAKEAREVALWLLLPLAYCLVGPAWAVGRAELALGSLAADTTLFAAPCFVAAVALAWWQTVPEHTSATWLWLLTRPVVRERVLLLKAAIGLALLLPAMALPLVALQVRARQPGHVPAPYDPAAFEPLWRLWLALPLVYTGSFLAGWHLGRPVGRVLAPMLGSAALAWLAAVALPSPAAVAAVAWLGTAIALLAAVGWRHDVG